MTPRSWSRVVLVVPADHAEDIAAQCFDLGSCGVHVEEAGEAARLNVYLDGGDPSAQRQRLLAGLRASGLWPDRGAEVVEADIETERDWNVAWRAYYRPVWATERIVVHPPWIPVPVTAGQLAISIDPAMAFGTGGHESTQLALLALQETDLDAAGCLDVGTGSGILSIAMVHLGAAQVTAVDIDPVVIDNARLNLGANLGAAAARVQLQTGSVEQVADEGFDVVVANIESHLVRPLLGGIVGVLRADGVALFSGLVEREETTFADELRAVGLTVTQVWRRHGWFSCRALRSA